jgi:hypothetical protein
MQKLSQRLNLSAAVSILVLLIFVFLPLRIIDHGFLPPDDALRHAAKAVSGEAWSEILLLRPEITIDHNPGWHAVLRVLHRATGWDTTALVRFSIIVMFLLFALSPLPWMERPELWLCSLGLMMLVFPYFAERAFVGRPLFLTMAVTLVTLSLWTRSGDKSVSKPLLLMTTMLFALSTWIHGSWYLLVLLPAAFLLARLRRKALLLGFCWVAGSALGGLFTGEPWTFLKQSALIPLLAMRPGAPANALVGEFQSMPFSAAWPALFIVTIVIFWRKFSGQPLSQFWRDPVLWLALLGWVLGFRVLRFWLDWGLPALALWIALQLHELVPKHIPVSSWNRFALAGLAGVVLILGVATDRNARWSQYGRFEALDARRPEQAEWLPEPGGILYSVNLSVFYQTFFTNPRGEWRYALGFEPSFMRSGDLTVYDELWGTLNAVKATAPWVKRMSPSDRLVLLGPPQPAPAIAELEWHYPVANTWVGRLRK